MLYYIYTHLPACNKQKRKIKIPIPEKSGHLLFRLVTWE